MTKNEYKTSMHPVQIRKKKKTYRNIYGILRGNAVRYSISSGHIDFFHSGHIFTFNF